MDGAGPERPDPERHDVEWLDDERAPGRVRRLLAGRMASVPARVAVAVVAVAAGVTAVVNWPGQTEAQPDAAAADAPALSEPLARSIDDAARDDGERPDVWRVVGPVRVARTTDGTRTWFRLVNGGAGAQRPIGVTVTGTFRGATEMGYRARCRSAGPAGRLVEPGERVVLRCRDVTRYAGTPPRLDRRSLQVVFPGHECESEGRQGPS
ncbi:hypothetical protein [Nocardioides caldifontis]|uniref:hypothetical protein n=1 Tax=Nocardioides caldifontis TaxID=2588938 RepID=UPI0011DF1214|nr:hypothetical protein [Nocardioides caldifontis]